MKLVNNLARIGYLFSTILTLQALSLTTIAFLQYGILNHVPVESTPNSKGVLNETLSYYTAPLGQLKPKLSGSNILLNVLLWITFATVLTLISIYIAKISSTIAHAATRQIYGKATTQKLFIIKTLGIGIAFMLIAAMALLLPAVEYILPLNIALTLMGFVAFGLQHHFARQQKTPVKHVL